MRISDWSSDVCSSDLLFVGDHVPQAAAVGADLVGQDDPAVVAIPDAPEFQLEVDQANADAREQAAHEIVDAQRHILNVVQFLTAAPVEALDMILGDRSEERRVGKE